jgi:hypothetical protein
MVQQNEGDGVNAAARSDGPAGQRRQVPLRHRKHLQLRVKTPTAGELIK